MTKKTKTKKTAGSRTYMIFSYIILLLVLIQVVWFMNMLCHLPPQDHATATAGIETVRSDPLIGFTPKCVAWNVTGQKAVLHESCFESCKTMDGCNAYFGGQVACVSEQACRAHCDGNSSKTATAEVVNITTCTEKILVRVPTTS